MLVLKRKEGQWVEITHAQSGDTLRVRVYDICGDLPGRANLAFDDPQRHFDIQRPERVRRAPVAAEALSPSAPSPEPPAAIES